MANFHFQIRSHNFSELTENTNEITLLLAILKAQLKIELSFNGFSLLLFKIYWPNVCIYNVKFQLSNFYVKLSSEK